MVKLSSLVTLFKAVKAFGYSNVAKQGFGKILGNIEKVGAHYADDLIETLSRQMSKEFGAISADSAMFIFGWKTGAGLPFGQMAIGSGLDAAVALLGAGAISGGSVLGLAEALQQNGNTSGEVDGIDLSTGVDDYRAEAKTGGHDFQYGALTMNLGGDNPSGHYEGTFGRHDLTVDPGTRNVFATGYDDTITSSDDVNVGNYIDGGEGNDVLAGGGGHDVLVGGKGNDRLSGGRDNDLLIGGEGADLLDGGTGDDTADYSDSGDGVTVDLGAGTGKGGDAEGDTLKDVENVIGSGRDDVLIGNDAGNLLIGGAGNDVLQGGRGDDMLDGGDGNDHLTGGDGDDHLAGGEGADIIDGGEGHDTVSYSDASEGVVIDLISGVVRGGEADGDVLRSIENVTGSDHDDVIAGDDHAAGNIVFGGGGNDQLFGRGGDDHLEGGAGADLIDGGEGNDTAIYLGSTGGVAIDLAAGSASGGDAEGDVLRGIENVTGGDQADTLRGDAGSNFLIGNGGNDLIEGRDGNDLVSGGDGDDVLDGGNGDDIMSGGRGVDRLLGGAGDDILDGGAGADVIDGGEGEDWASYAGSTAGVQVDLAAGTTAGGDAAGDVLTGIEHLIGSGHNDALRGDAGRNFLSGGAGNDLLEGRAGDDTLDGGAGADTLDGGEGIDTADYSASNAGVAVDLTPGSVGGGGTAQGDILRNIENITGSAFDDTLTGDAGANVLVGGAGNDRLVGGDGADTLDGGDGVDTVNYGRSAVGVVVDLAAGTGKGGAAEGDVLKSIENVNGSDHADTLIGNAADNRLDGGAGNDVLDGGAGNDVLIGGTGTNTLRGGEGSDTVDYSGATAGATVDLEINVGLVSGGGYANDRYDSIENVIGTAFKDNLRGNAAANQLFGGAGDDLLRGLLGDDVIEGGAGADLIEGGDGIDTLDYRSSDAAVTVNLGTGQASGGHATGDLFTGMENLRGSAHADTLTGDANANVIEGGAGADVIDGGLGSDTATYASSKAGVSIDLGAGTAAGGDAEGDKLRSIENLVGSASADRLVGDAGANASRRAPETICSMAARVPTGSTVAMASTLPTTRPRRSASRSISEPASAPTAMPRETGCRTSRT